MKILRKVFMIIVVLIIVANVIQGQTNQQLIEDKTQQLKINAERIESKLNLAEVSSKEETESLLLEIKTLRERNLSLLTEIKKLKEESSKSQNNESLTTPIKDKIETSSLNNINNNLTTSTNDAKTATSQLPPIGINDESCFWVLNGSNPTDKFSRYLIAVCNMTRNMVENENHQITLNNDISYLGTIFAAEVVRKFAVPIEIDKERDLKSFIINSEQQRTDKQVGSDSKSNGTTSLAVKGGGPSVIGWAVENGAATADANGTTVTVRVNPFGLSQAISGSSYVESAIKIQNDSFSQFLKKASVGFSFDTTRGNETPTFIVSKQQLSAVSFRYEFINERDPRNRKYLKIWDEFYKENLNPLSNIVINLENLRDSSMLKFKNAELQKWLEDTNKILKLANTSEIKDEWLKIEYLSNVIKQQTALLPIDKLKDDPNTYNAILGFLDNYNKFVTAKNEVLEKIRKGTVVTFEYTNNREPIAPNTSNFRFIWEKGIFNKTSFTFNASLTTYNKKPVTTDVKRIRDFQFALQTETPLGNTFGTGDTTLTFAGKYERLNSDVVSDLGLVTPNSKGDIAIGQIKFTIPISDWGIKLPLSVTFANRTDLIKESVVRANFGLTFDLDPLFARFKPF